MSGCAAYGCSKPCGPGSAVCQDHARLGAVNPASGGDSPDEPYVQKGNPAIPAAPSCGCSCDSFVDHIEGCRVNDERNDMPDGCGAGCEGADTGTGDWLIWPRSVLLKVVKEAIAAVYAVHPDIFAVPKEVTLDRGRCLHILCDECMQVTSVMSVDGYDCNEMDEEDKEEESLDFLACLYPDTCKAPGTCGLPKGAYDPGWWRKDEGNPCAIRFKNPTPTDRDVKALVSCVDPCVLDCTKPLPHRVCTEAFTAIIDNALFRLYLRDHKDGTMPALAQAHWNSYIDTMTVKFKVDFSLLRAQYLKGIRKD